MLPAHHLSSTLQWASPDWRCHQQSEHAVPCLQGAPKPAATSAAAGTTVTRNLEAAISDAAAPLALTACATAESSGGGCGGQDVLSVLVPLDSCLAATTSMDSGSLSPALCAPAFVAPAGASTHPTNCRGGGSGVVNVEVHCGGALPLSSGAAFGSPFKCPLPAPAPSEASSAPTPARGEGAAEEAAQGSAAVLSLLPESMENAWMGACTFACGAPHPTIGAATRRAAWALGLLAGLAGGLLMACRGWR
jgi:hypothetical protein